MSEQRFATLTERQRTMLRYVLAGRTSAQIARELSTTPSTVDDQMKKAMAKLGLSTRHDAAVEFAAFEAGLQRLDPQSPELSKAALWPLLSPVPTKAMPTNDLAWQQVILWGMIIAIGCPLLITVAALLVITLRQLMAGVLHP